MKLSLEELEKGFKGLPAWEKWDYFEWMVLFMHEISETPYHLETTQLWIDGHIDRKKRFDDDKIDRGKK